MKLSKKGFQNSKNFGKKIKLFLVLFLVALTASSAVAIYEETQTTPTVTSYRSDFQVIATRYEPYPVDPGEYVDVWLKVANTGREDASDFTFMLEPEYPFSVDESEEAERNFGKIFANSMVLLHYKVRVAEDAVEGETPLKFKYKTGATYKWVEGQTDLLIQTIDATVAVSSISSEPERIAPGEKSKLKITVKNLADSAMKDVTLKLDLALSTMMTTMPATATATIDDYKNLIPLAPIDSATEKKARLIKPGENYIFTYEIMAYPDAEAGVYRIPILLKYYDELDKEYDKEDIIGIVIGSEPDLSVLIESSEIYSEGAVGTVVIKFVNKGLTDVKLMNIKLKETENYEIISTEEVYIGNIDSDDYETADFKLYLKDAEDDMVDLPLEITYKDANNEDYEADPVLKLKLYSQSEAKKLGLAQGSSFVGILILVILVAGGFFGYRKWKKRKAAKK